MSVDVTVRNLNVEVTTRNLNVEVATKGIQGASGTSAPTGLYATIAALLAASGELQTQINNISGGAITFITDLTSGVEAQFIAYPSILNAIPEGVSCEVENNVDNFVYSFVISSVTTSGFNINFSDNLTTSGYKLYSTINL